MQHHKYSLTELENMMPWERDVYVYLLLAHIQEEERRQKQEEQKMLLARADNQMKHIESARTYDNKGFQWTRRIIALTAVFFIIGWPKIVPVFFDTSVYLTWTEFTRGFLFLIEQKEITMDKEFFGVVITPLDTHLMSAIIGLYFGGSLVKK